MQKFFSIVSILFFTLSLFAQTPDTAAVAAAESLYQPKADKGGVKISASAPLPIFRKMDNKIQYLKMGLQKQVDGISSTLQSKVNQATLVDTAVALRTHINAAHNQIASETAARIAADAISTADGNTLKRLPNGLYASNTASYDLDGNGSQETTFGIFKENDWFSANFAGLQSRRGATKTLMGFPNAYYDDFSLLSLDTVTYQYSTVSGNKNYMAFINANANYRFDMSSNASGKAAIMNVTYKNRSHGFRIDSSGISIRDDSTAHFSPNSRKGIRYPSGNSLNINGVKSVVSDYPYIGFDRNSLVHKAYTDDTFVKKVVGFVPTSSNDNSGATGDIATDSNFIYIKTASGWKRATLSTF